MAWTGTGTTSENSGAASSNIVLLGDLLGDVLPWVPGASDVEVMDELRAAARRFCEQSGALTEEITITTVADQAAYALAMATPSCEIERIQKVQEDGAFYPEDPETYRLDYENGRLVFEDDYVPSVAGRSFVVTAVLVPARWAAAVPTRLVRRYWDGIAAGAAATLMRQPKQPWTHQAEAERRDRVWGNTLSQAMGDLETKGTGRAMRVEA